MDRDELKARIAKLAPELKRLGLRKLSLFGSFSRNESGPASDIDFLAEFDPPRSSRQYFDVLFLLEDSLDRKVDLAEPDSLHPRIREAVLNEAILIA